MAGGALNLLIGDGLFIMVVEGSLDVENELLESRDAIMLSDIEQLIFKTTTRTRILAIEVPMLFR